MTDDNPF